MSSRKLELQIKTEFLEVVEGVKSTSGNHKAKCKNLIIRSKKKCAIPDSNKMGR